MTNGTESNCGTWPGRRWAWLKRHPTSWTILTRVHSENFIENMYYAFENFSQLAMVCQLVFRRHRSMGAHRASNGICMYKCVPWKVHLSILKTVFVANSCLRSAEVSQPLFIKSWLYGPLLTEFQFFLIASNESQKNNSLFQSELKIRIFRLDADQVRS